MPLDEPPPLSPSQASHSRPVLSVASVASVVNSNVTPLG